MNDIVLQKLDSGLLTITMNRPDRRNALGRGGKEALIAAFEELRAAAIRPGEDEQLSADRLAARHEGGISEYSDQGAAGSR